MVPVALKGMWGSVFSREGGGAMNRIPSLRRRHIELEIGKPIPPEQATPAHLEELTKSMMLPSESLNS